MARSIEDLSALARRGGLSPAEARRLEVYLNSSAEARELHELGIGYDRMRTERPGDDALLRRVAERASERYARRPLAKPAARAWRSVGWFVAGVLLASVAGASAWRYRLAQWNASLAQASSPSRPTPAPSRGVERARSAADPVAAIAAPSTATVVPPTPAPESASPVATTEGARAVSPGKARAGSPLGRQVPLAASTSDPEDAPALFSRANAERKSGDLGRALASYEKLRRSYPTSPEARLSSVLSARLELRSGDAAHALADFDHYLAVEPNGALAEEALQGKAQALRTLGRSSEEQQAWRLLLERFPQSVQARTARDRLTKRP